MEVDRVELAKHLPIWQLHCLMKKVQPYVIRN